MFNDNSIMPFGIHKDKTMTNVPADYLLYLLRENKCSGEVKQYIEENKEVLEIEVKNNKKGIR